MTRFNNLLLTNRQNLRNASNLLNGLRSPFSSLINPFRELREEIISHPACNHSLFSYLQEQSKEGFTPKQWETWMINFLSRTQMTIPSIAMTVAAAAKNNDYETIAETAKNLWDEAGYGNPEKVHSKLLFNTCNLHSRIVFGMPEITFEEVKNSNLILPATINFVDSKLMIFNWPYQGIVGNTWAHEFAADGMLTGFERGLFRPFDTFYSEEDLTKSKEFFHAHRDETKEGGDIELQHGQMAEAAAIRSCKGNIDNVDLVREGAMEFLSKQNELWTAIEEAMQKARHVGKIVSPNKISKINNPSFRISNAEISQVQSNLDKIR
jgi:hypothetical protein